MIRVTLISVVVLINTAHAQVASFTGLGDLPGGYYFSDAKGISGDGTTVVGISTSFNTSGSGYEAFRWTLNDGIVGLGDLAGGQFDSWSSNVSQDGDQVVGFSTISEYTVPGGTRVEAFLWDPNNLMLGLGDLTGNNLEIYSKANDISNDGAVIVGVAKGPNGYEAFYRTQATGMVGIGSLITENFTSQATVVSSDGLVIAGLSSTPNSEFGYEAFRWDPNNGMIGLGDLDGGTYYSRPYGISADGSVIVGQSGGISAIWEEIKAFYWTLGGGMIDLGDLSEDYISSVAYGVSDDGKVVVGSSKGYLEGGASIEAAFVWDAIHGMRSIQNLLENEYGLDLTGWTLISATCISNDALIIAGTGKNPNGKKEAWVATFPPPPANLISFSELAKQWGILYGTNDLIDLINAWLVSPWNRNK
jgi:probable HAF family extracellular repeat protein